MARHKAAIAQAIGFRIENGLEGQMHAGDMFALWTFGESVSTNRYPPMVWMPSAGEGLAGYLRRSWENQPFNGDAQLAHALGEALQLTSISDSITLLIITDGTHPVAGTPFDQKINATLQRAIAGDGAANAIFVTTLLARDGRVIGWSVTTGDGRPVPAALDDYVPAQGSWVTRDLAVPVAPSDPKPALDSERSVAEGQPMPEAAAPQTEPPSGGKGYDHSAPLSPVAAVLSKSLEASESAATASLGAILPAVQTEPVLSNTEEVAPSPGTSNSIPIGETKTPAAGDSARARAHIELAIRSNQVASAEVMPPAHETPQMIPSASPNRTRADHVERPAGGLLYLLAGAFLFGIGTATLVYFVRGRSKIPSASFISQSIDPGERTIPRRRDGERFLELVSG
ncbi:MAG: hypothetical protein U1G07_23950 [Verrucomicrobiota bacterium]